MMNNYSSPKVTLAVGAWAVNNFSGFVRVYECRTNGCEQIGNDIIIGDTYSVSLSRGEIDTTRLFLLFWTILQIH
jgi:hypothetical protein